MKKLTHIKLFEQFDNTDSATSGKVVIGIHLEDVIAGGLVSEATYAKIASTFKGAD